MNSATETIRVMLDERGVEHWDTEGITEYRGEYGRIVRCYSRLEPITLDVAIIAAPPEQAIEATLGSDLKAENEKLRELVGELYDELDAATQYDAGGGRGVVYEFADRMRELGIEADA